MITRKIALALAAVTVLAPVVSNASAERISAKACANAFAMSIASPGASASAYKLAYHSSVSGTLADFYPSEFTFTLEAHDPKTGLAIARARCSTDTHGVVTQIASVPVGTKPTLAAQF